MRKKLADISREELWKLFPILLVEHKTYWASWFKKELVFLKEALNDINVKRVSHVGSTAIESILAKPIIDILLEVEPNCGLLTIKGTLQNNGYTCMFEEIKRISFNRANKSEAVMSRHRAFY